MSHNVFKCPECRRPLGLPDGLAKPGDSIICPCCDKSIQVPESRFQREAQMPTVVRSKKERRERKAAAAADILFDCSECRQPLKLRAGTAARGDIIICPECRKEVTVPKEGDPADQSSPTVVIKKHRPKPEENKESPAAGPGSPKKSVPVNRRLIVLAVIPLVLVVAVLLVRLKIVSTCRGQINELIASCGPYGEITYEDLEVSALGRKVVIEDIVFKGKGPKRPVMIGHLALDGLKSGVPSRIEIEAHGLHVPIYPETMGKAAPGLRALDYHCLCLSLKLSCEYDAENKMLSVSELRVKAPAVGECVLSAELTKVDLAAEDPLSGCGAWGVREAEFRYRDDSFMPRFIAFQAQYIGETVEELNAGMLTDLDAVIAKENRSTTKEFLAGFRGFVQKPEHMMMGAAPAAPVSFKNLKVTYDQKGVMGLIPELNLSFSPDLESR